MESLKNDRGTVFKVGDGVMLKKSLRHEDSDTAKIRNFYDNIDGGVVLDRHIAGFRSWNINDLVRAR